jgi:transposase-like protein
MAKRFSPEFKQQAIEYTLANSHEPIAAISSKLVLVIQHWINGFVKLIQPAQANASYPLSNSVLLSLKRKLSNSGKPTTS